MDREENYLLSKRRVGVGVGVWKGTFSTMREEPFCLGYHITTEMDEGLVQYKS